MLYMLYVLDRKERIGLFKS